ncbi:uncharacterized protein BJX67DRAFT_385406 [Aspergillus lucknowensis]|uniref:Uncharacterized protein n=1 Tax=Aspergillus lucknowensis TaxID=176173 RepID=A0ABR4LF46_9EURO
MGFLHRFQETNSHLLGWYESVTHDILVAAAKLQADIPHDSMSSPLEAPSDMSGEATIIALALRCFMDFHIFDLIGVDCYAQNVEITSLLEDGSSVEVLMLDDSNPFLTATAYKDDKQQDKLSSILSTKSSAECNFDSDLHTMLGCPDTVSVTPYHGNFTTQQRRKLARYYYVCTEGGRILSTCWNKDEYPARVYGRSPASSAAAVVEHAGLLHDLWFDGDEKGQWNTLKRYKGLGGFQPKWEILCMVPLVLIYDGQDLNVEYLGESVLVFLAIRQIHGNRLSPTALYKHVPEYRDL